MELSPKYNVRHLTLTYTNEQLAIGWAKKDNIDWSVYEEALKDI